MTLLMDGNAVKTAIAELAARVTARHQDTGALMLVGIERRGADLAARIARKIAAEAERPLLGTLDINLYRDDWTQLAKGAPHVGKSHMPASPDGRAVILIDDVLFSGRTIRAAMEAVLDYGRPDRIELLVLVDRGHRELPIAADYAGRVIPTEKNQHVDVLLEERDGKDAVLLL